MKHKAESIFKTTFITTVLMLVFKIFGFLKQAVIAGYFGATESTDIYFLASEFVFGLVQIILEAMKIAIIAEYTRVKFASGKKEASGLIGSVFTATLVLSCLSIVVLQIFAPWIAGILAPEYNYEQISELKIFIRLTSFSFAFLAVELVGNSVLDSEKKFILPRVQSFILSVSIILFCVLLARKLSVYSLVLGQYFADALYCIVLLIGIRKFVTVKLKMPGKEMGRICKMALPLFLGNGMIQINGIVDKAISSGLGEGSVSALAYSHVLIQFVTRVLIVNIGEVLFAHFSNFVAEHREDEIATILRRTLNLIVYLMVPISVITFFCAEDIVRIVYFRGTFTVEDVLLTATVTRGYSLAFVFYGIRDILTKSMYAYHDSRTPMINGAVTVAVNIVLSIILSKYLGIIGISLGTAIAAVIATVMNMWSFKKRMPAFSFRFLWGSLLRSIPSFLLLNVMTVLIKNLCSNSLVCFGLAAILGFPVYFGGLYLMKAEDIDLLVDKVREKLKK